MGNRAVIAFGDTPDSLGVYLHWNGGRPSVEAFLSAAKELGIRDPLTDDSYAAARLCQIIGNWFGGTTSVGVNTLEHLDTDNGDNGTYYLGPGWTIARRAHHTGPEEEDDGSKQEAIRKQVVALSRTFFEKKT